MSLKNTAFLIFFVCLMISCGNLRDKIDKGNRYYNLKKYYDALQHYKSAAQKFPKSDIAHYDSGNALYKSGKFTEAAEEYRQALASENRVLRQKAYYNLGNTYLKMGDLEYAINSYKNALNLNQRDFDAKYNLELVLEQLRKRQSQRENQQEGKGARRQEGKDEQSEMSREDVMRILEALKGDEKNLQVLQLLRRIPEKKVQVEKDW